MTTLTSAERLKFELLGSGLSISDEAQSYIRERNGDRPMTPADYASTSGVILVLEDDVWVNAPLVDHNPNFVTAPMLALRVAGGRLMVQGIGFEVPARLWLPPAYHGQTNRWDEPFNSYAFTHADRVRISPIEGCSLACRFCDLPYEFRYRTKRIEGLVDAVDRAASDPVQPAQHVLISGGTPRTTDFGYVRAVYEAIISRFAGAPEHPDAEGDSRKSLPVDVMMMPLEGLLDPAWLNALGVNELSVNIEIYNRELAHHVMRRKADHGLDHYLRFLEEASGILGPCRVRSMLLVGLEPMEDTLAGVAAIAERGCVPVLSPFRPDPATPMRDHPAPSADFLEEAFLRSSDVAGHHTMHLGPSCAPCTHNTLTFAAPENGEDHQTHGAPNLI